MSPQSDGVGVIGAKPMQALSARTVGVPVTHPASVIGININPISRARGFQFGFLCRFIVRHLLFERAFVLLFSSGQPGPYLQRRRGKRDKPAEAHRQG